MIMFDSLVISSEEEIPVSVEIDATTGAFGACVSIITVIVLETVLTFPAKSLAFTVKS